MSSFKHFILPYLLVIFYAAEGQSESNLDYAKNFTITKNPTHTLLKVHNTNRNATEEFRYALVPKNQDIPRGLPSDAVIIRTPVERVVLMETVYIGYMGSLDKLDKVCGAASTRYIKNPIIVSGLQNGLIKEVQSGQKIDLEQIVLLKPDLILSSTIGLGQSISTQLERVGLPVVFTSSYMERHPLARTEWLKFIAYFFDSENLAKHNFERIKNTYEGLVTNTKDIIQRPKVFSGAPYSGVWHVPGGDSYMAKFIHDAGGNYIWSDDQSQGAIPLDTERVFLRAALADIWLHPNHYNSIPQLIEVDSRFAKFSATKKGSIYNNILKSSDEYEFNFWERGIVRPDEILADLILIFQPHILPEHELLYYYKLK